jgi:hypothetical protein
MNIKSFSVSIIGAVLSLALWSGLAAAQQSSADAETKREMTANAELEKNLKSDIKKGMISE